MNIPQTIILADGDFPSSPLAGKWLRECRYVVCCDGAANAYLHFGKRPAAIVGDGDSLLPEIKERYAHLIHREAEQDTNDLSKAFRFCLSQGRRDITIMGATGKREDHTLGNISLLIDYMRTGAHVRMLTDYGIFIPCHDTCSFPSQPGQQISIINFGAHNLRGEGLVYPLSDFTNWWQGTLNESTETEFTIHAEGEYLVIMNYLSSPLPPQSTHSDISFR